MALGDLQQAGGEGERFAGSLPVDSTDGYGQSAAPGQSGDLELWLLAGQVG